MSTIRIQTHNREELIEVTEDVRKVVKSQGFKSGILQIFVPHTTAAVTINENADPDVQDDILKGLREIVPDQLDYRHAEGNSPAHIKSSMIGVSQTVMVKNGNLQLGRWQGIYFCEFDGPRTRDLWIKFFPTEPV